MVLEEKALNHIVLQLNIVSFYVIKSYILQKEMHFIDFICHLIGNVCMFEIDLNKTLKFIIYEKINHVFDVGCLHFFFRSKIIYC